MSNAWQDIIGRLHVLMAESVRCLNDDRFDAVHRKLIYADDLLKELAASLPAPPSAGAQETTHEEEKEDFARTGQAESHPADPATASTD